jgi:hypothetical protein
VAVIGGALAIHTLITKKTLKCWQVAVLLGALALGQGFSELSAAFMLAGSGVLWIYLLATKRWVLFRRMTLVLVALLAGFALVYFSGGSINRRAAGMAIGDSTWWAILASTPKRFVRLYMQELGWWQLGMMVSTGLLIAPLLRKPRKGEIKKWAIVLFVLGILGTYLLFALSAAIGWMDLRAMTLTGVVVAGIAIAVVAVGGKFVLRVVPADVLLVFTVILCALTSILVGDVCVDMVSGVATRNHAFVAREASIKEQLSVGVRITVPAVPVKYPEKSGAIDLKFGEDQVEWFDDAFRQWYKIGTERRLEVTAPEY